MPPSVCEADRGETRRGIMPAPNIQPTPCIHNPDSITTEELCHYLKNGQSTEIGAANL